MSFVEKALLSFIEERRPLARGEVVSFLCSVKKRGAAEIGKRGYPGRNRLFGTLGGGGVGLKLCVCLPLGVGVGRGGG